MLQMQLGQSAWMSLRANAAKMDIAMMMTKKIQCWRLPLFFIRSRTASGSRVH
jgi:hypothetical protein